MDIIPDTSTRVCTCCHERKPLAAFYLSKKGYIARCRECLKRISRARYHGEINYQKPLPLHDVEDSRRCRGCGETKPIDAFYFAKNKRTRSWRCKQCMSLDSQRRNYRYAELSEADRAQYGNGRTCTRCKQWLTWDRFKRNKCKKSGHDERCYDCQAAIDRERYRTDPVYHARRRKHKGRQNKEKRREAARRRQSRLKNHTPGIREQDWVALCHFFGNVCLGCGSCGPLTLDHVIPVALGGADHITNAQPLCNTCNTSKGHHRITDYRNHDLLRQFLLDIAK